MLIGSTMFPDAGFRRSGSSATWSEGLVSAAPTAYPLIHLGGLGARNNRYRGGLLTPVVSGAEDAAISFGLWAVQVLSPRNGDPADQLDFIRLGTGTAAASAMQGGAGLPVGADDRICDTITFTADAATTRGGALLAALTSGSITEISPEDDTPAALIVPDLGAQYAAAVEFWSASAAITGRMLVSLWT